MSETARLVYIVDDDQAVSRSTGLLLRAKGIETRAFASAEAFLSALSPEMCGCVLADVRMPGMTGLELQQRLADEGAQLAVVIMTGHGDVPMAVEAMKQGAVDFLEKPFALNALLNSVERAFARLDETADGAPPALDEETRVRLDSLTTRERDVLDQLVLGQTNKVIAYELGISQRTVEVHRARIKEKLGAASLSDLIRLMR